ncbi:MAG: tetratricopeptide repeat protein [Bacteroidetes bacterium]|nr:tetratricopeptide repeat protein [Bacteroidota bacterium]
MGKKAILTSLIIKYWLIFLLLHVFVFSFNIVRANELKLDSLKLVLAQNKLDDLQRIEVLISLFSELYNQNSEQAEEYIAEAITLATEKGLYKQLGNAYHRFAMYQYEKSLLNEADRNFGLAIETRRQLGDSIGLASSIRMRGVINYIRGEFAVALEYTSEAIDIFTILKDTLGLSNSYNDLGVFYDKQDEREKALEYYMKAIEMRKLSNQGHTIAQLLNNVAIIYGRDEDYKKSLDYFDQAAVYAKDNGQSRLLSAVYANIAMLHSMMGNYTKAGNYYMLSLEIKQSIGDKWGIAYLYNGMANNYQSQKFFDKAHESYQKSLIICVELSMKDLEMENYKNLSELMVLKKDFENALFYYQKYFEFYKDMTAEESRKKISEIQAKFEDEKKIAEIEILTREKEVQNNQLRRNRIYIILLITAVFIALVFIVLALLAKKEKERYYKFAESLNRELEDRVSKEVEENRKKDIMLAQQNKQAVMGEMINNIAHQWRQPLNSLGIIVQNIEEAYKFGEVNQEYLKDKVEKSMSLIKYMDQTIDDFRYFFKPNKTKEFFEVKVAVKRTLEFAEEALKKQGIQLNVQMEDEVFANGYSNEYSQVVLNILNNSKEALVENQIENPWLNIRLLKKDNKSLLMIEDNAGGIKASDIESVFQPYYTTKEATGGSGLGLYMSKIIIEKNMDGNLTAINTDKGARFYILL